jgi:hypothetical protein
MNSVFKMAFLNPPFAPLFQRGERGISPLALLKKEMQRNLVAFLKKLERYTRNPEHLFKKDFP